MIRSLLGKTITVMRIAVPVAQTSSLILKKNQSVQCALFSTFNQINISKGTLSTPFIQFNGLLKCDNNLPIHQAPLRSVTKFSLIKGKRKTVKAVIKRFKRLDWGAWIRTHSGRNKKLFKKSGSLKRRLKQHVFTNATQSWLLDKMVTNFWRRPKYYFNDPYSPYHKRDEYFATKSQSFKV